MSHVRLEYVPVRHLGLGWLGFDHLQLVFVESEQETAAEQDDWYVLEGDCGWYCRGRVLGVLGHEGQLRLAAANLASGERLIAKIGTPERRGSRIVPAEGKHAWQLMVEYARRIDANGFRYRPCGAPLTPFAAVNSSSVVASLLWRIGIDVNTVLPHGLALSPGLKTLLGTPSNDSLKMPGHFDAIFGGGGDDDLTGSNDPAKIDRLLGGPGNDVFHASAGLNIVHGGDPSMGYDADGYDTAIYDDAVGLTLKPNRYAIPHIVPDFVASFAGPDATGTDWLYSIEAVRVAGEDRRVVFGPGTKRLHHNLAVEMGEGSLARGTADFSKSGAPIRLVPSGQRDVRVSMLGEGGSKSWWVRGAGSVIGSNHDDDLTLPPSMHGADGGPGNDRLDARTIETGCDEGLEFDHELRGGDGDDTLISGCGRTLAFGGDGNDTFILGALSDAGRRTELVIADATPQDRLLLPVNFFNGDVGSSEGSPLFPLAGGAEDAETPARSGSAPATQWSAGAQTFCGRISFHRDAGDVVIHVVPGRRNDGGHQPVLDFARETLIRVQHYQPNQLGLTLRAPALWEHDCLTHSLAQTPLPVSWLGPIASTNGDPAAIPTADETEDTLTGTSGPDIMVGGAGDDTYHVDHPGDIVVEHEGEGIDKVVSSIDYTLPANVEDLTLTGTARIGVGNAAGNVIVGNDCDNVLDGGDGCDVLYGAGGTDVLIGGAGSDTYVCTPGAGDKLIVDQGPSDDTDELILTGGVGPADVACLRPEAGGNDIMIVFRDGGSVRLQNQLTGEGVEAVRFDDGTVWTRADLETLASSGSVWKKRCS